jgi:hypothetical protein
MLSFPITQLEAEQVTFPLFYQGEAADSAVFFLNLTLFQYLQMILLVNNPSRLPPIGQAVNFEHKIYEATFSNLISPCNNLQNNAKMVKNYKSDRQCILELQLYETWSHLSWHQSMQYLAEWIQ